MRFFFYRLRWARWIRSSRRLTVWQAWTIAGYYTRLAVAYWGRDEAFRSGGSYDEA